MGKVKYKLNRYHIQEAFVMRMYYTRNNMQLPLIVHKILYQDIKCISQEEAQELNNASDDMEAHIKLTRLLVEG